MARRSYIPLSILSALIFFSLSTNCNSNINKPSNVLLFIAVKSGPGLKNERYRQTARNTWLDLGMKGIDIEHGFAYKFFVDGPCCEEESLDHSDMVIRYRGNLHNGKTIASWLHPSFEELYSNPGLNYKTQWERNTSNYGRDWDIGIVSWVVRNYQFKFILCIDDDAMPCTQNLIYTLNLMPSPPKMKYVGDGMIDGIAASLGGIHATLLPRASHSLSATSTQDHVPFVLGYPRWDSYDNCFVLMSSDVAQFFESRYYDLLRPTHTVGDKGATLGAAWSSKHGRWSDMIRHYLSPHFVRKSGNPHCEGCGEVEPDHVCHASPLVDHRPASVAWTNFLKHPSCENQFKIKAPCPKGSTYCHCWGGNTQVPDPSRICVDKLFIDKMKDMSTLEKWWRMTWPQNTSVQHHFKPSIAQLLSRDRRSDPLLGHHPVSSSSNYATCVPSLLLAQNEHLNDIINASEVPMHLTTEMIAEQEQELLKRKAERKAKRANKKDSRTKEQGELGK